MPRFNIACQLFNRTSLRGKLLFQEQIRRNRLRPERFFTRADQFVTDVPASRLLKAGLDVCRRHGMADATRRGATSLLAEFDDVSDYAFTDTELDSVKPDRRIALPARSCQHAIATKSTSHLG
jgi:5-methylcytosine-specific restriction enzyme subunit McrC